ncbi:MULTISPECIES: GNAT family N-acetyltransferase [unclassified Streptomyces]|uniref:GNAT family N-acetyltransferase n=1 Tax=unclassified Streptomyces TaxID=2593676 RepID=UPI0016616B29|nr:MULTISPECIES: GNAT family N-acetyltransferase [unclassified Streptomyces]MBD0708648.1 GNAT family N-acetyltransferase [Streptomyces sp. CBMA291]MBD0713089.1 GNAT family N-acetyltransferase [Streptomyces sp. CBMA370]
MDLKWYTHSDAPAVRSLLLDVHDEVYADDPDPFHSRERFSYFLDLWSGREDWRCVSGWQSGGPVGYAYGSMFKPGGWWKGSLRPRDVRGRIFALSELMVVPSWQGTGRARRIHDALVESTEADFVTLLVDSAHPKVRALYEKWGYAQRDEAKPSEDSPVYAVMVRAARTDAP